MEITTNAASEGKVRSKKMSTRIDMTPMVDLAFLLLTFFILTTKLAEPYVMRVEMPEEDPTTPAPPISATRVLNLVLNENNKIYWYIASEPKPKLTEFSKNGIRHLLAEKNTQIKNMYVLIKPSDKSHYSNLVDILDEMAINSISRYAVVDYTKEDQLLIEASNNSAIR